MSVILFTLLIFTGAMLAGLVGSLTGLGGGVVLIPLLTLVFHVDMRYAIGASLISVIATSSGAAAAYVREGYTNVRIGMFLEVATTLGALIGAFLATRVPTRVLGVIFGLVLLYAAWQGYREQHRSQPAEVRPANGSQPDRLRLAGTCPDGHGGKIEYQASHAAGGFATMIVAGILSGMLGIGSGAIKVLAMDRIMRIPFKVSTTTSNFMIGVTAAASAGIYLRRGYVDSGLTFPVILGVLAGSMAGARLLMRTRVSVLRAFFVLVVVALGVEMIIHAWMGQL